MALGMFMFVNGMSSWWVWWSSFLVCVPVYAYGGVVGYLFLCFSFLVSFVSCIVMMSGCVLCTRFLVFVLSVCISDEPIVCYVCSDIWLSFVFVYWFVTKVTIPNDCSVFVCVCGRARIWVDVCCFGEEQGQPTGGLPEKGNRAQISRGRKWVDTVCAFFCSNPTSCRLCLFGLDLARLRLFQHTFITTACAIIQDTGPTRGPCGVEISQL